MHIIEMQTTIWRMQHGNEVQTTIWRMQHGNEVWVCWPASLGPLPIRLFVLILQLFKGTSI